MTPRDIILPCSFVQLVHVGGKNFAESSPQSGVYCRVRRTDLLALSRASFVGINAMNDRYQKTGRSPTSGIFSVTDSARSPGSYSTRSGRVVWPPQRQLIGFERTPLL